MAVDRAHREGAILLSLGTLTELFEVLSRKQFRGYIDEEDMRRFLAVLTREAQMDRCRCADSRLPRSDG
jgi:hypothetical protein